MEPREILLSPIKIGTRTSENRFFSQAMECTDADAEGNPSDLTYARYENLFRGEAGMVSLEAITITDKNRGRLEPAVHHAPEPTCANEVRPAPARGEPEDHLHLPAHPFWRAEQS